MAQVAWRIREQRAVPLDRRPPCVRRAARAAAVARDPHRVRESGVHRWRRGDRRAPRRAAQRGGAPARQGHRGLRLLHLAGGVPRRADAAPARRLSARLPRRGRAAQAHRADVRAVRAREDADLHALAGGQYRARNRARHPRRREPARQVDRNLPRQPAAYPGRRLCRPDTTGRERRERLDQSRRDRRQRRAAAHAARGHGRPMRRSLTLAAVSVLALLALEITFLHWMQPLENRLLDTMVRAQAAGLEPDPDIVLVNIDENSLVSMEKEAGRWPWPRVVHAELLEGLAAQKPRAVVFDIMFTEPDQFRPQDDAAFAETVAQHPNTYFPLLRLPPERDPKGARIAEVADTLGFAKTAGADAEARVAVVPPLILPPEHWRVGLITFTEDPDGVGRRYLLRETVGGWRIPSLPARVAADLGYPVPDADDLVLAWRGRARAFQRVSYSDLYEDFKRSARQRPADEFTGKIVIIGTAATGLHDQRVTPIDSLHPGAEILGTAIENLKNSRAMRYTPQWAPAGIGAALVLLLYLAFRKAIDARATGAALAVITALLLAGQYLLVGRLVLLPLLTPLAAAWTFYAAAGLAE